MLGVGSRLQVEAAYGQSLGGLRDSEALVLRQVSLGKDADLNGRPDRKIRADFVVALFTGKIEQPRVQYGGVAILNAQIEGNLDLAHAEVHREVMLN